MTTTACKIGRGVDSSFVTTDSKRIWPARRKCSSIAILLYDCLILIKYGLGYFRVWFNFPALVVTCKGSFDRLQLAICIWLSGEIKKFNENEIGLRAYINFPVCCADSRGGKRCETDAYGW